MAFRFLVPAIFSRLPKARKSYYGPLNNGAFIDFRPRRGRVHSPQSTVHRPLSTVHRPPSIPHVCHCPGLTLPKINVLFYQWSAARYRAVVVIIFGTRRGHS